MVDFYLSPTRTAKAAKRFLGKALRGLKAWEMPPTINTDQAAAYVAAINELKQVRQTDALQSKSRNATVSASRQRPSCHWVINEQSPTPTQSDLIQSPRRADR